MRARTGSLLVTMAAKGAAITPPNNRPTMTVQFESSSDDSVKMKTTDCEKVMKNSEELTEPMAKRGCLPRATNVVVTMGPQPPPPMASKKPPIKPSDADVAGHFIVLASYVAGL